MAGSLEEVFGPEELASRLEIGDLEVGLRRPTRDGLGGRGNVLCVDWLEPVTGTALRVGHAHDLVEGAVDRCH